jgi:hypothetical protein
MNNQQFKKALEEYCKKALRFHRIKRVWRLIKLLIT